MTTDPTALPLYQIERVSLTDPAAPGELARRYAEFSARSGYTDSHRARIITAWLAGWKGEPNPYRSGNNFTAPYQRAYHVGKRKRHELEVALNGGAW